MKIKTSELKAEDGTLDWVVAKLENPEADEGDLFFHVVEQDDRYTPSTDWSQGGPIIERESITISPCEDMETWVAVATFKQGVEDQFGPTPLIAAMRCYVASKFGGEVEIPEGLCK